MSSNNYNSGLFNTRKSVSSVGKAINGLWGKPSEIDSNENQVLLIKQKFEEACYEIEFVEGIIEVLKKERLEINFDNAEMIHFALDYNQIKVIIFPEIVSFDPKTEEDYENIKQKMFHNFGYENLDISVGIYHYQLLNSSGNLSNIIKNHAKNVTPENIIAINKLVDELEANFVSIIEIDSEFLKELLEKRPLVVLTMLTKPKLRSLLFNKFEDALKAYIGNVDCYKKLVPFIKIHSGKTHGQWRHLADPNKTCIVLKTKNCVIASSKNTQKSFDKSEIEGKFLVLQGLSIQTDSDNSEVHYLEV